MYTFRDHLIAEKIASERGLPLNTSEIHRMLDGLVLAYQHTKEPHKAGDPIGNHQIDKDLEFVDIINHFKKHLIEWLKSFKWKEGAEMARGDAEEGHIYFWNYVEHEFDDLIKAEHTSRLFSVTNKPIFNRFVSMLNNLILKPILNYYRTMSPQEVLDSLDQNNFSSKSKDLFGDILRKIEEYETAHRSGKSAEDIVSTRKALMKYELSAKQKLKAGRRLSKRQRLELVRRSAEKIQGDFYD